MSANTANTNLSADFNQILDLALGLPKSEKHQLANLLLQDDSTEGEIPESQKQLVRTRIKKYNEHPDMLIGEEQALEIIKNM